MVGGVGNYATNEWNRATHPHTAGSSFKPFVYLTGLIKGVLQPDSIIDDAPFTIEAAGAPPYSPRNFDGRYRGWMTARDALAQSRNVCSVRVAQAAGIDNVIETAHQAGIKSQLDAYPSLALGSCAVSPLELANAYATLARYGAYMPATTIRRIETNDGKLVRDFTSGTSQNLPPDKVAQLVDVMQDVVRHGTGTAASLPGISVAGKTGTADKGKDLWFVGFTPDTVTAVWGGSDLNRAVAGTHVTGGTVMARIWKQYMSDFYSVNKPPVLAFVLPTEPLITAIPYGDYSDLATVEQNPDPSILDDAASIAQQAKTAGIISAAEMQKASTIHRYQRQTAQAAQQEQFAQPEQPAVPVQPVVRTYENARTVASNDNTGKTAAVTSIAARPQYSDVECVGTAPQLNGVTEWNGSRSTSDVPINDAN
jgi:membrane peptidoglycan carboxypeptidase